MSTASDTNEQQFQGLTLATENDPPQDGDPSLVSLVASSSSVSSAAKSQPAVSAEVLAKKVVVQTKTARDSDPVEWPPVPNLTLLKGLLSNFVDLTHDILHFS
jgi:hypothetical protein